MCRLIILDCYLNIRQDSFNLSVALHGNSRSCSDRSGYKTCMDRVKAGYSTHTFLGWMKSGHAN